LWIGVDVFFPEDAHPKEKKQDNLSKKGRGRGNKKGFMDTFGGRKGYENTKEKKPE